MSPYDDPDMPARRAPGLPGSVVHLLVREAGRAPVVAITLGLQWWERTRDLRDMARRRANEALQIAAHTPLGRFLPQPVHDDDADEEAQRLSDRLRRDRLSVAPEPPAEREPARPKEQRAEPEQRAAGGRPSPTRPPSARPAARKQPTQKPTQKQPAQGQPAAPRQEPAPIARELGAPGTASEQAERVTAHLGISEPESRTDLPIPDFDNVSIGSLRARLRSLSLEQLVTLREWEQAHAHRLPIVTLLDNRIAKMSAESPAYPSGNAAPGGTLRV